MLTLRRGVTRVGWVLLALWLIVSVAVIVYGRLESPNPPPLNATVLLQFAAGVVGWPLAVFLLWRLVLWIGQGFWQKPEASTTTAQKAFQLGSEFWTVRTMALAGALLFTAYGAFGLRAEWALGGDYTSRAVGTLVAYAAIGAIFGAVTARFLPKS